MWDFAVQIWEIAARISDFAIRNVKFCRLFVEISRFKFRNLQLKIRILQLEFGILQFGSRKSQYSILMTFGACYVWFSQIFFVSVHQITTIWLARVVGSGWNSVCICFKSEYCTVIQMRNVFPWVRVK